MKKRLCLAMLAIIFFLSGCDLIFNDSQLLTGTVTITGLSPPTVGAVLTAAYTDGNGKGTATWQWLCGDDVIDGASSNTYTVKSADVGKTIKARVRYANNSGSVTSVPTAAVVSPPVFVAVTSISGVPTTGPAGTPLPLTGTVVPANATNKTIVWSVVSVGTTGASVSGTTLNATAAGTAKVRATIADGTAVGTAYTQDSDITVTFVAVTSITGVPTSGTTGEPISLNGTVVPANATYKNIAWSVTDTTSDILSVSIIENILTPTLATTATGSKIVTVWATIANGKAVGTNYTQPFSIAIAAFFPVADITSVTTTVASGSSLTLNGTVEPNYATKKTIEWSVISTTPGVSVSIINGNTLKPTGIGTTEIRATIKDGIAVGRDFTKDFTITVTN
jgi:endo-1,4-beta-xylanase